MAGADPRAAYAAEGLIFPELPPERIEVEEEEEENIRYLAREISKKKSIMQ